MTCPNCANAVDAGAAFCPNCGASLIGGATESFVFDNSYNEETLPMMPPINEMPSTEFCLKCGKVLRSGQHCTCSSYAPAPREYEESKTEKTRIDNSMGYVSPDPLNPTYKVPPRYEEPAYLLREEPPRAYPVPTPPPAAPTPTPEKKPVSDGRSFFKSVNKL